MIHRDCFRVSQLAGLPIEILKNDLWMRISNQAFVAQFLRHVEHIINLNDAKVRVQPFHSLKVGQSWRDTNLIGLNAV